METLYPVILPVPASQHPVMGREKVRFLSAHARSALQQSARLSAVTLGELSKDKNGVPRPCHGIYWSITHKPLYVGGVVADIPIGLDIEPIKTVNPGLYKKVAAEKEWRLGAGADAEELFYRYWTAKEALIKTLGTGIKDMRKCHVVDLPDRFSLELMFGDKKWAVEHYYFNGHVAAIIRNIFKIEWKLESVQD